MAVFYIYSWKINSGIRHYMLWNSAMMRSVKRGVFKVHTSFAFYEGAYHSTHTSLSLNVKPYSRNGAKYVGARIPIPIVEMAIINF